MPSWRVANRGIDSGTTEGMLACLDFMAALEPKAVSLMASINDLSTGHRLEELL